MLPGGVILVLVAETETGELVRNRVVWTYTMGCGMEDSVVVKSGDVFGWTTFVSCFVFLFCRTFALHFECRLPY